MIEYTDKLKLKNQLGKTIIWTEKDDEIREKLYNMIINSVELEFPDFKKPFILSTDASKFALGAVLEQEPGKIVGLYSYKLKGSELNYTIVEKELFAVIKAIEHFRKFIICSKILVKTDSKNVSYLNNKETSRSHRWRQILNEYDIDMEHINGETNVVADYISRNYYIGDKLREYFEKDEQLFFKRDEQNRCIVKVDLIDEYLQIMHEELMHPGIIKMYKTLNRVVCISGLFKKIELLVKKCKLCQINKLNSGKKYGIITGYLHKDEKLKHLSSDIYGPISALVEREECKVYIITFIDLHSRYLVLPKLESLSSLDALKIFQEYWCAIFGTLISLLTDLGRTYISKEFRIFCDKNNIELRHTSGYNPTGNSISERVNQTIGLGFRIYKGEELDFILTKITHGYNNSYHSVINCTPFEVVFGKCELDPEEIDVVVDTNELNERAKLLSDLNNQNTNEKRIKDFNYKKDDFILLRREVVSKGESYFEGPYLITETKDNLLKINIHSGKNIWVNIKRCKPFWCQEGGEYGIVPI